VARTEELPAKFRNSGARTKPNRPGAKALAGVGALYRRFVRGDRKAGYQLAAALSGFLAPDYLFLEYGRAWTTDEDFVSTYRRVVGESLIHTADKKWFLRELARSIRDVPGEIAECGSYLGWSAYFLADATEGTGKQLHLFDSWEGLSSPVAEDGGAWAAGDLTASETACLATLDDFSDRVVSHQGWIPDRFGDVEDCRFALVHIDVDLYEPHRDALRFFWPRLNPGGMMVFDDHGSSFCPGVRRAIDEYLTPLGLHVLGTPTGQAFVSKPAVPA